MSEKPRVIFDTQIILRATINHRSLPARLFFSLRDQYELVISAEVLEEVKDVLSRPKLRAKFKTLTDEIVNETIAALSNAQTFIPAEVAGFSRDPKDDKFLALALESKANYLVSEDNDLLVLNPFQGIQIINALDFLNILVSNTGTLAPEA